MRPSKWTTQHDDCLRKLCAEGKSNRWIGDLMGWSFGTIKNRRAALGIPPSGSRGGYPTQRQWKKKNPEKEPMGMAEGLAP